MAILTKEIVNNIFERLVNIENIQSLIQYNSKTNDVYIELWRNYILHDYRELINQSSIEDAYSFFNNHKFVYKSTQITNIIKGYLAEKQLDLNSAQVIDEFYNLKIDLELTFERFIEIIKNLNIFIDTEILISEKDFQNFCNELKNASNRTINKYIKKYSKSSLKYLFYDVEDDFGRVFYDHNLKGFNDFINNTCGETTIVLKYKLPIYAILAIKYKLEELDFIRGCYDYDFELWVGNKYLILPHYFNSIQISKLNSKIRVLNAEVLHNKIFPTVDIKYKGKLLNRRRYK